MSQLSVETYQQTQEDLAKLSLWIFETIKPYIKGRTLEMDSNSGVMSSFFVDQSIPVHLNAPDETTRSSLTEKFKSTELVKGIHCIDYSLPDVDAKHSSFIGRFSTVIAPYPGIYHGNPKLIINKAKLLLKSRGHLILFLPSFTVLFPGLENDFKKLKSYDRRPLQALLEYCEILKIRYFCLEASIVPSVDKKTLAFPYLVAVARTP
jgi:transposase